MSENGNDSFESSDSFGDTAADNKDTKQKSVIQLQDAPTLP